MATTSLKRLTKRLEIRPLQMRDDRAWWASHVAMLPPKTSWEIPRIPYTEIGKGKFTAALNQQKEEIAEGSKYTFGIFHKEVGTLLGFITIEDIREESGQRMGTVDFRLINIYGSTRFMVEC